MHPVFLDHDRLSRWQTALGAAEPTATAIHQALQRLATAGPKAPSSEAASDTGAVEALLGRILLAWWQNNASASAAARDELAPEVFGDSGSDLGKAADALTAVEAWDAGAHLWDAPARARWATGLQRRAQSFLQITQGNPHDVTNNWWMLTHGGCFLASLAAHGEMGEDGTVIDLANLRDWALGRVKAFCAHFGSAGLYHEGIGYSGYTLSMLMPAVLAASRHLEPHLLDEFPVLRRTTLSMAATTAAFWHRDNGAEQDSFGASLQWNDAGRGCFGLNPFLPGLALTPPAWQGGLRTVFDRLLGVEGRNQWGCAYRGLFFVLACYPLDVPPADPNAVLPRWVWDHRQGLGIWRSAWGRGDETVLGWYSRATHAGGHAQDDAATVRLLGRGRTWLCSGGQARAKAVWQGALTHAQMEDRPKPTPLCQIFHSTCTAQGGVVGIDTRKSLVAYSERYLAWRSDLGPTFVLALLDTLDSSGRPPRSWQWNLSFPRELEASVAADGSSFVLHDAHCGTLRGHFLFDRPDALTIEEMPASQRTYSSGKTVDYPGDRYLHASYRDRQTLRILCVLTLTAPDAPAPLVAWPNDGSLQIDGQRWAHPFAPAILPQVDLLRARPNRMVAPGG